VKTKKKWLETAKNILGNTNNDGTQNFYLTIVMTLYKK